MPYYQDDFVTLYHGDCRALLHEDPFGVKIAEVWATKGAVLVTDPPYGIAYKSNSPRATLADSIEGDEDTSLRDEILEWWAGAGTNRHGSSQQAALSGTASCS